MPTLKHIHLEGDLPQDLGESALRGASEPRRDAALELRSKLAEIAGPSLGLQLEWSKTSTRTVQLPAGGTVAHYRFTLEGRAPLSLKWIEQLMVATVLLEGRITYAYVRDIEHAETLYLTGAHGRAEMGMPLRLWIATLTERAYPEARSL